jgi:uncharacterized protein
MARRKRRPSKPNNFSLKTFLHNYPIVPVLALVFIFGVWAGFVLGRKSVHTGHETKPVASVSKKIPAAIPLPKAGVEMLPNQVLPKKVEPKKVLPPKDGPKLAIVIDDIGYNKRYADELFSIDEPVTLAILPQLAYSHFFADEGKKRGYETILHLPLEPMDSKDEPGAGEITVDMSDSQVLVMLDTNLRSVPGVVGVNNHMGSKATRDPELMSVVAKELGNRNLFFLDSMTHPKSVAHRVSTERGVPTLKRDIFLDNEDDFDSVLKQIDAAARIAKSSGQAIAIGHIRHNTLQAIKKALPRLERDGVHLVTLKELL